MISLEDENREIPTGLKQYYHRVCVKSKLPDKNVSISNFISTYNNNTLRCVYRHKRTTFKILYPTTCAVIQFWPSFRTLYLPYYNTLSSPSIDTIKTSTEQQSMKH